MASMRWLVAAGLYVLALLPTLLAPVGRVHVRRYLREFFYRDLQHAAVETLANVAIFVPLGWCLHRGSRLLGLSERASLGITVATAAAFSWSIETLQYFIATRYSSIIDIAMNTIGALRRLDRVRRGSPPQDPQTLR
jgi:hypothetical protein